MSEVASGGGLPAETACEGEIMTEALPIRMIDPAVVQRAYAANVHALKAIAGILGTHREADEAC